MEEKWKRIRSKHVENIKDMYKVSNFGRIMNCETDAILSTKCKRAGHNSIGLMCNGDKKKTRQYVHRLVAMLFVDNPDPEKNNIVNHRDGNKENNRADNLEWTSVSGNNQHAIDNGLLKITKRAVIQYDDEDNKIAEFESLDAASKETGINDARIVNCCKGKRIHTGGFKWKYRDINPNENPDVDLDEMKRHEDFPNYYIDKSGKVYSKPYKKWLKFQKHNDGFMEVQLANKGKRKTFLVHRLIAEYYLDGFTKDCYVRHIDGDKTNNSWDNLRIEN